MCEIEYSVDDDQDAYVVYVCPKIFHDQEVLVSSKTTTNKTYYVNYYPQGIWACNCKGFTYRGECSHIHAAAYEICSSFYDSSQLKGPVEPGLCMCGEMRVPVVFDI